MPYTTDFKLPQMPAGPVDWAAIFNALVDALERGRTVKRTAGEALVKGDPFYVAADGKAYKASNSTECWGGWFSDSTAVDAEGYGQIGGKLTVDSWTWTPGSPIYVTVGKAFSETGENNGKAIGIAQSATEIWLVPQVGLIQQAHIADAKTDYTTGDLDSEAEIIAALNSTNGKINSILTALEELKMLATS